ncbi:hypothetical protein KKF60_00590 [Patescibacteria group bacterium]|nr:hypothetical protein [Patescibacteria group bacterium]MBU4458396.1 hypothetical protein [Patescibacteria group bacterium]MCG2695849.1 DUF5667 domain-containing protein [Candidatus Portnoybacteria bacterium]
MDEFIVKQLKNLRKVRPSTSWLESQRSFLLSKIAQNKPEEKKSIFTFPIFNISKLFRPVFVVAMVLIVFASSLGTIGVISAAQNSLPGDALYVLKTTFEKTQMTFAYGDQNKVELSIKFATQRMDEFAQVASKPEKRDDIEKTVQNLNAQLVTVQENMDKLKDKNSEKAAEVARLISNQTNSYKETLIKTSNQLAYLMPEESKKIKAEIDQALIEVDKTQEKAEQIIKTEEDKTEETPVEETIISPSSSFEEVNEIK